MAAQRASPVCLARSRMSARRDRAPRIEVCSVVGSLETGQDAGDWLGFGRAIDAPVDQRAEDGRSLSFDTEPLTVPLEILGVVRARLLVSSDQPVALVAARLCDVAPDGASTLVTRGLLNLTHRESDEWPAPLPPGEPVAVALALNAIAHSFPPGHRCASRSRRPTGRGRGRRR